VYEDAADIFIRARDALIESVDNDVDIDSSMREYIFAKSNLRAHGFDYDPTWREMMCDNLVKQERRERFVPSSEYKRKLRVSRREHHKGHLPRTNHFAGRIKRNDPSVSHGMPVSGIADSRRHHSMADEHILSAIHDPLEKKSMTSGVPRKIDFLARRFLPNEEGNSRAKDVKRAERLIEDWMKGTSNPHVTENKEGTYSYPLFGPLGDSADQSILSHEDDIYERDFRRWSRDNAAARSGSSTSMTGQRGGWTHRAPSSTSQVSCPRMTRRSSNTYQRGQRQRPYERGYEPHPSPSTPPT